MIKTLVVDLILILNVYKQCNWLGRLISNTVSNMYLKYFNVQFKWTLSILHSLKRYFLKDGYRITYLLVSCIMVASISFMTLVMTFWTNQAIVNIKYIFLTSDLLLNTVCIKPTRHKNSNKYTQGLILKVLRGFFHILTRIMLCLRNIYRQV